ncbi:MAG: S1 RNA-binding domain-containing protein [Acutalibacteraceae bacterium]|nr:S1 RNA-binding domain-containing protein [Acutalibacteraceae bacterium]
MAVEVGSILEGKVTGITDFGAFVDLPDGKSGMVHISEVAPVFVNKITDFLSEGQVVKVKVLSVGENGKISLSIKKAMDNKGKNDKYEKRDRKDFGDKNYNNKQQRSGRRFNDRPRKNATNVTGPGDFEWQASRKNESASFEDLMSKFKQTSEEKFSDLKRNSDVSPRRPRRNQK